MDRKTPTHSKNADGGRIPDQKELERELSEYLSKKYGDRIKIVSPFVVPKRQESMGQGGRDAGEGKGPDFNLLPEELESFLEGFVVKQERAKAVLATKICTHFNRVKLLKARSANRKTTNVGMIKNNILLIGPTGVGKTYIIKLIAQKLGVPFVKGDATKFSETGYVGGDVEDLVRDLVYEAKEDIELAEHGIIYIDEIDKIASAKNIIGHDVSRTGVQRALLKPMEETEVDLKVPHDPVSQIQAIEHYRKTGKKEKKMVNTRNILFIMSGAFGELAEIIRRRLQRQGLGFEADVRSTEVPWDILHNVTAQDLIEFGFESEFVGRLPVIVVLDELVEEDLVAILRNPNNPIILSKRLDFRSYGIDICFEEEALRSIAAKAAPEKTGARALVSAMERVLIPFEKRLPSTEVTMFLVTPEVVDRPEEELMRLLSDPDDPERMERFRRARDAELENIAFHIRERTQEFSKRSGLEIGEDRIMIMADLYLKELVDTETAFERFQEMVEQVRHQEESLASKMDVRISFEESAVDEIIRRAIQSNQDAGTLAYHLASRVEYGLRLVKERSGQESFVLDGEAVRDMEQYVNRLLKDSCRGEEFPRSEADTGAPGQA